MIVYVYLINKILFKLIIEIVYGVKYDSGSENICSIGPERKKYHLAQKSKYYTLKLVLDLNMVPYLFGYKMGFSLCRMTTNTKPILQNFARIRVLPFTCLNNPKDLDLSYKMDLDFWDCFCFREKKPVL